MGYQQSEYFISGTAVSYTGVDELGADGRWEVEEADTAEYTTRILVYRPRDANAFSGTVIIEWLNVSGGLDAAPDWSAMHTEIIREGLIHSRGGGSSPLSQSPQAQVPTPEVVRVRDDLNDPVLMFQTETDLLILGSLPSRQPDSSMFRLWEVAGTSHNDVYSLLTSNADLGNDPSVADVVEVTEPVPGIITCDTPINSGPQHWVLKAGLHGLVQWTITGAPVPEAPRLSVTADGEGFELDDSGNVLGGIRTNYVDSPVAVLSGLGQTGESFCGLFGTTRLFDEAQLAELYPTHQAYLDAVTSSTESAVAAGFILPVDAALIIAAARASDIGNQ